MGAVEVSSEEAIQAETEITIEVDLVATTMRVMGTQLISSLKPKESMSLKMKRRMRPL